MNLDLPDLDLVPPEELDHTPLDVIEEEIEAEEEDNEPFIKQPTKEMMMKNAEEQEAPPPPEPPKKKKRELSQKQLDHLARMREKANEKRIAKMKAKEEALAKVNEEHAAKSYKKSAHRKKVDKEYKAKTIKVKDEVEQPPPAHSTTPPDFVPSHKEKQMAAEMAKTKGEQEAFINFMMNMERYKVLKENYKEAKARHSTKAKDAQPAKPPVKKEVPKAAPIPISTPQAPVNKYSDMFG